MAWTKDDERTLRRELVKAFPTETFARLVLQQAGVNTARVDFSGGAESMWFSAISEASRGGKLDALLHAATEEASSVAPFDALRSRVAGAAPATPGAAATNSVAPGTPDDAAATASATVSYVVPGTPDTGVDWDSMTGPTLKRLSDAIQSAFPSPDALRLFMEFALEKNLFAITSNGALPNMVFDVLVAARAQGWLRELFGAALAANPGNKKLAAFAANAVVSRATVGRDGAVRLESVSGPTALQSAVPGATPYQDMEGMILALSKIRAQVCRVEIGGVAMGTGFLVGPSTVLTNWHVVHDARGVACDGAAVVLRFDFLRAGNTIVHHGTEFRLEPRWLVDTLPPSALERGLGGSAPPTLDELDYALLRVADEPGRSPVGGDRAAPNAPTRGWVRVPPGTPALLSSSPLSVVQHPLAEPLSIATSNAAILGVNANRTRVTYAVHTERGSSGSPCFDKDWSLVALHHSGEAVVRPRYNEGIPIDTIRDRLTARGFWSSVGNDGSIAP